MGKQLAISTPWPMFNKWILINELHKYILNIISEAEQDFCFLEKRSMGKNGAVM